MPVTETTEMVMLVIQEMAMPVIQAPRGGPGSENRSSIKP